MLVFGLNAGDQGRVIRKVASDLADRGFDVDVGPLDMSVQGAARMAVENDVHVVGMITGDDDPIARTSEIKAALDGQGATDAVVVMIGTFSKKEKISALNLGALALISPDNGINDAVDRILRAIGDPEDK